MSSKSKIQKNQKNKSRTPRRPRRKRRAQGKAILSKPGGMSARAPLPMMVQQAPVSAAMVMSTNMSSTKFKKGRVEGQRLQGRFALAKVANLGELGESQNCLDPFGDPGAANVYIEVNPETMFAAGSREYFECLPFAQFKFTRFRLMYVSQVPTTETTNVAMSYQADATSAQDIDPDTSAYDRLIVSPNSLAFPAWTTGVVLDVSDQLSQNWFYVDQQAVSDDRLQSQGLIYVQLSSMTATALNDQLGLLYVDYTLELLEPRYVTGEPAALARSLKAQRSRTKKEGKLRSNNRDRKLPESKGVVSQSEVPQPAGSAPSVIGARLETDVLSPGGVYAISGQKTQVAGPEVGDDEVVVIPPLQRQPVVQVTAGKDRKSSSRK